MNTSALPLEEAHALDPGFYTSQRTYDFEMERVIRASWQVIAPASLVRDAGDVIARQLGDVPVIVLRLPTGELQGFYNICPHRAGPLARCDARGLKSLRCGYHGWTYGLDGKLKAAPEMKEAAGFSKEDIRLTPIDVKEWNGVVLARAGEGPSFSEVFAGIDEIVGGGLEGVVHHTSIVYDVRSNWKIYADNYLEGYHLPFVHPGLTNVVDYGEYTTQLGTWWSLQRSPVDEDCGAYAAGEGLYFFIHPNTMLNIMPGRLQTNRIVPTG
ncbi:MAG: aromatic ring-hydroxylating dioxygenase subunit alpha, partial [Myxococcota bacterium]